MPQYFSLPPMPSHPADAVRWEITGQRVRLLEGRWKPDLERKLEREFGLARREAMGPASTSKNTFKRVCEELSSLYTETPRPRHAIAGEVPGFLTPIYLDAGGTAYDASATPRERRDRAGSLAAYAPCSNVRPWMSGGVGVCRVERVTGPPGLPAPHPQHVYRSGFPRRS